MKRLYTAPATEQTALSTDSHLLTGSDYPPEMNISDNADEGFNKDNNFTDWLSNKKNGGGFDE